MEGKGILGRSSSVSYVTLTWHYDCPSKQVCTIHSLEGFFFKKTQVISVEGHLFVHLLKDIYGT